MHTTKPKEKIINKTQTQPSQKNPKAATKFKQPIIILNLDSKNGDIYTVDHKFLNKCSLKVFNNILEKETNKINNSYILSSSSESYSETEKEFILKNKDELI